MTGIQFWTRVTGKRLTKLVYFSPDIDAKTEEIGKALEILT